MFCCRQQAVAEKKTSFEFIFYVRFDSVNKKHYTKYTRKYCQGWFYENSNADSVKPIL